MSVDSYSQGKYIKALVCPGGMSPDDLPSVCRTETGTICGSFLTSTGPCRRFALRGCPLRRDRRYQLLEVSA